MLALIVERDGVLNYPVDTGVTAPVLWNPITGALEAIARICHAGWQIVVAHHEPAIGRGAMTLESLHRVHNLMQQRIHEAGGAIDAVIVHTGTDPRHPWHLPNPGLFEAIARRLHQPVHALTAIGVSDAFIAGAHAGGAQTVRLCTAGVAVGTECEAFPNLHGWAEYRLGNPAREARS